MLKKSKTSLTTPVHFLARVQPLAFRCRHQPQFLQHAALQSLQSHHQWVQWREFNLSKDAEEKLSTIHASSLQEFAAKLAAL